MKKVPVAEAVGQVHDAPHIADHAAGRQGTESDDLGHLILPVLFHNVVDNFLTALVAEIHVDIGHGYSFRVQETLKEELVPDRINVCDF